VLAPIITTYPPPSVHAHTMMRYIKEHYVSRITKNASVWYGFCVGKG
jgi:hypothetical protein